MKLTLMAALMVLKVSSLIAGSANVRVLVVDDEQNTPVANVDVVAYFTINAGRRAWNESSMPNKDFGLTDAHGQCRFTGETNCGEVGCWIEKPPSGYYRPRRGWGHKYTSKSLLGIWQPENLVATIRLQRVEHPIPLLVRQFEGGGADYVNSDLFAKGNGRLEVDLIKGDWLPPVGNGVHADIIFTRLPHEDLGMGTNFNGRVATSYRDSMAVEFTGKDNGLVEVACTDTAGIMIRNAPEDGYESKYLCWKGRMKSLQYSGHFDRKRNFAFRIRTQRDENGEILSAYYGKVYGDITFKKLFGNSSAVASVTFLYYLNPTPNDRNLEWDMKHNLCSDPGNIGNPQP